jgi:hypothetical protein
MDLIWIGTKHNLRGPSKDGERGDLIQPFVPFTASQSWMFRYQKMPRIGRRIMTVEDYLARLEGLSLKHLQNEARQRGLSQEGTKDELVARLSEFPDADVGSSNEQETSSDDASLSDCTVEELREKCREQDIAYSGKNKAELIDALEG